MSDLPGFAVGPEVGSNQNVWICVGETEVFHVFGRPVGHTTLSGDTVLYSVLTQQEDGTYAPADLAKIFGQLGRGAFK